MEKNSSSEVINTINEIFRNLFSSIDKSLYDVLDDLSFVNSDILNDKYFGKVFGTSASNGILLVANSLLIGYILYFAVKYMTSNFTFTKVENPGQFILKLIIYGICMNCSYFIIAQILDLNSNISLAIRSIGEDIFRKNISFSNLITSVNKNLNIIDGSLNIFSADGLIKGTMSLSLINLVSVYALRYVMIKVLVLLSPFAILSRCLESTSWFFKMWFRNLFSLLLIQNVISIVLLILFSANFSDTNLMTKFIYIGAIQALIKANSFTREFMSGSGISVNASRWL